jgi:asparagine synthase (glutamine-hydrolysing)
VLFNGEAIFGVVNFGQDHESASRRAREIAERATKLGIKASLCPADSAVLGYAGKCGPMKESEGNATGRDLWVVSCGELIDRQESLSCYGSEPGRSAFLASGIRVAAESSFLQRLDGTFAAAIWREKEQRLMLICDRRCDCRLYYSIERDRFVFSSWLPLLETLTAQIDRQAVAEFLRFLYIAPPRTIYSGVSSVEPGHYLSVTHGAVEAGLVVGEPASVLADQGTVSGGDEVTCLQTLIEQSAARRLGRRNTGIFLSSGVDSATLMGACQRVNPDRVQAFTVGFDSVELDEAKSAAALANQIGVPHRELKFSVSDYVGMFEQIVTTMDQPFGDPAQLPLGLACQKAKDSVEVICDGTGSDGLFGAPVPRHLRFSIEVAAKFPRFVRRAFAVATQYPGAHALSRYAQMFDFDDAEELFITWSGWGKQEMTELLGRPVDFGSSAFYRAFRTHAAAGAQPLFNVISVFPPDDSRFEAAALARIPIELPYHDADLMAYVHGLPESMRVSGGQTKILLRRLFARYFSTGRLPEKKHYFNIPLQSILAHANFAVVHDILAPARLQKHGLIDSEKAWMWIDRFIAGEESLRFKVWALLVLHSWLEAR